MLRRRLQWLRFQALAPFLDLGDAFDGHLLCDCADGPHGC
jgi:hypothetical protein